MEVFDEEAFDECPVLLKGVEHRFEFFRFEGRTGQLRHLTKRDDGEFFNQFSDVFLTQFCSIDALGHEYTAETTSEILHDVTRADEGLDELSKFGLRKCMALLEQVGVGMAGKEFHDVPKFLIGGLVANRQNFLEVFVGGPYLVPAQVDALMEAMGAGHALQVHAVEFTATTKSEVITDFIHLLQSENLVFMTSGLMQVMFVEQCSLCNLPWLWVNHRTTNHAFARHFETDVLERLTRCFVQGGYGLAVEV